FRRKKDAEELSCGFEDKIVELHIGIMVQNIGFCSRKSVSLTQIIHLWLSVNIENDIGSSSYT
ncbi:hypothetical protein, partial [Bacteroides nordii]